MDTWVIIVIAVILIIAFVALAGRSMFAGSRGDNSPRRTGEELTDFSDDPPSSGRQ